MATAKGIAPDASGASIGYIPGTHEGGSLIHFSPANEYIGSYLQTLYGWTNNSSFYMQSSEEMKPFYRMVQNWERWCTGVVPTFHNFSTGVVPTLLAQTVVRKCSDLIYGGGVMFELVGDTGAPGADGESKKNEALSFISDKWAKESGFKTALQDALYMECELGTSAIKLNKGAGKDLWCEAVPFSRMFPVVDARGRLDAVCFYLRPYIDTKLGSASGADNGFVLVEERFYAKDKCGVNKPHRCCRVYRSGTMINQFGADSGCSLGWEQLPYNVKKAIKADYGDIRIGEPALLPFTNLGVFLLRFTPSVSKMPWLKFGDSAIERCIEDLCKYDILSAQFVTEMYASRARIVADKAVRSPGAVGYSANTGIDDYIFTRRDTMSTEGGPITVMQPDIRSEQIKSLRNTTLENIATAVGISPSSFAPYLQDNSNRTAREVSAEESATALFVENKRDIIRDPLSDLLKTVLRYYGYADDVVVQFSKAGQTNYTLLVENTVRARSGGIMSLYRCIEQINPGMDQSQLLEEFERIKKEDAERMNAEAGAFPEFDFGAAVGGDA